MIGDMKMIMHYLVPFVVAFYGFGSFGEAYAGAIEDGELAASIGMNTADTEAIVNDLMANNLISSRLVSRSSPECWTTSIASLNRWNIGEKSPLMNGDCLGQDGGCGIVYTSGSSFCAAMTDEQLEVLALELTRCQLKKANRPLFDSDLIGNRNNDQAEQYSIQTKSKRAENHIEQPDHKEHRELVQVDKAVSRDQTRTRKTNPSRDPENSDNFLPSCPVGQPHSKTNQQLPYYPSQCLPYITEHALTLYNQILLHTSDLCRRLTDDLALQQKEETTLKLVQASMSASNSFHRLEEMYKLREEEERVAIFRQSQRLEDHALKVMESLTLQVSNVAQKTASMMEEINNKTLAMAETNARKMKEHQEDFEKMYQMRKKEAIEAKKAVEIATVTFEATMEAAKKRELESIEAARLRDQYAAETAKKMEWEAVLAMENMKRETEKLMKVQAERMREQEVDLERMRDMISNTNSQIQPLSTIENYVRMATSGLSSFKSLVNLFISLNVVWLISSFPLLNRAWKGRHYSSAIILLGFILELVVVWLRESLLGRVESEDFQFLGLLNLDKEEMIGFIRFYTRSFALMAFFIPLISSYVLPSSNDDDDRALTVDDLLKSQMEFVAKLNHASSKFGHECNQMPHRAEMLQAGNFQYEETIPAASASGARNVSGLNRGRRRFVKAPKRLNGRLDRKFRRRQQMSQIESSKAHVEPLFPRAVSVITPTKPRLLGHDGFPIGMPAATCTQTSTHPTIKEAHHHVGGAAYTVLDASRSMDPNNNRPVQLQSPSIGKNIIGSRALNCGNESCDSSNSTSAAPKVTSSRKRKFSDVYGSAEYGQFFSANSELESNDESIDNHNDDNDGGESISSISSRTSQGTNESRESHVSKRAKLILSEMASLASKHSEGFCDDRGLFES